MKALRGVGCQFGLVLFSGVCSALGTAGASLSVSLLVKSVPAGARVEIDGRDFGAAPVMCRVPVRSTEDLTLQLTKTGFAAKRRRWHPVGNAGIRLWLDPAGGSHDHVATVAVSAGGAPKQVHFSPDGRRVWVTLLGGKGVDVIDLATLAVERTVTFGPWSRSSGFVEVIFDSRTHQALISQMTTARVHAVHQDTYQVEASMPTGGEWSKVIALIPGEARTAYVSNWVSNDVSVINLEKREVVKRLGTGKTPRGIAVSPDGRWAYVAHFGDGRLVKVDARRHELSGTVLTLGGSLRHVVMDAKGERVYVSSMSKSRVFAVETATDRMVAQVEVGANPNTIAITPDGNQLYVSCRGKNGATYLKKGPELGRIDVVDIASFKVVESIPGGNQPTGLDVSPDGLCLCFSNFLDHTVEFHRRRRPGGEKEDPPPCVPAEVLPWVVPSPGSAR